MKEKLKSLFEKIKESFSADKMNATRIVASAIIGTAVSFLLFYVFLPPINLRATEFYVYLTACLAAYLLPLAGVKVSQYVQVVKETSTSPIRKKKKSDVQINRGFVLVTLIPLAFMIIGMLISSPLFCSRAYAGIITVKDSDFNADLPESNEITNIALMDTDSAMMLGNRELGSLSEVVSQYTVSPDYVQINYRKTPQKVASLEYDGFFKWLGNRSEGVPGMVMVAPVKNSAGYMKFDEAIKYTPSAYFGEDLERKLRFSYPTKIFDSISFEVDDEGNPFYIVSCAKPQVMLFGAMDVTEVIIFNPSNGESEIYDVKDAPAWIDIVYTGNLASEKFNWQGLYSGGFFNSIIGNVGCKQATDDFGYVVLGDDVWYFTGVTSAVADDMSNIGFILTNARTGEYRFYSVNGAEEHSAMAAAEGEVQEKGYVASFPSLINVSGQPTYIMVLKDAAGLVKLYALVNVENYSTVATGATQSEAMSAYKKLLRQSGSASDNTSTATVTVENVRIVDISDVATVYITTEIGVLKGFLESDEALILIKTGDKLNVEYSETGIQGIYSIASWEFVK